MRSKNKYTTKRNVGDKRGVKRQKNKTQKKPNVNWRTMLKIIMGEGKCKTRK